ncbi:16S rRNA (cytosine(1402)-N(4))-methyltransferase RsmH [Candidatus Magnetominusculus dajiuhuensis]|uniref:16S rRNA (cytosine(1402)-N(4))-methyltransferase RsmH n=1 Tax=Candidatus Magnetominusculus dajiuhuensis TaxID=3137712 RepID=UPI003B42B849
MGNTRGVSGAIHCPVMVDEVMELLDVKRDGVYVDGTLGMGGHAEVLLKRLGADGRVIGVDKDEEALMFAAQRLQDCRVSFVRDDFSRVGDIVKDCGYDTGVDGILLDLGMSMCQVKDMARGFSFNSDYRLDMRMDNRAPLTAWEVVNRYKMEKIEEILKEYGEETRGAKIARAIVAQRKRRSIDTCRELASLVEDVYGGRGRTHPATQTFQALRIYVNGELAALKGALEGSGAVLRAGGRLCVISYHSLEDRLVKNFFRQEKANGHFRVLTVKPITPSAAESGERNPAARSAKLRGGQKL